MTDFQCSQAWDDAAPEARVLAIRPDDEVLAIAGAGDNALALLLERPRALVAVDTRAAAGRLLELKAAAVRRLAWGELLELAGVRPSGRRDRLYAKVRQDLGEAARTFWDGRPEDIRRGLLHIGAFERSLRLFRAIVLATTQAPSSPFGPSRVSRALAAASLEDQRRLYRTEWDSWRWRAFARLFFGRAAAPLAGGARGQVVAEALLAQIRRAFEDAPLSGNWRLEYLLTGDLADERALPPWLLEESQPALRGLVDRLTVEAADAPIERVLGGVAADRFAKISLGTALERAAAPAAALREVVRIGKDGAVVCYRLLGAPPAKPWTLRGRLAPDEELTRAGATDDRSLVPARLRVERLRKPRVEDLPGVSAASALAAAAAPIVEAMKGRAAKAIESLVERPLARFLERRAAAPSPPPEPPPPPAPAKPPLGGPPAAATEPVEASAPRKVRKKSVARPPEAPTLTERDREPQPDPPAAGG